MNKPEVNIVIVMPIGPGSNAAFVIDTLQSYLFYTRSSCQIILADDSGQGIGSQVAALLPGCELIVNTKPMGGWAGLYITLASAYSHALQKYKFSGLLKLDTDALIIGPEPEKEALELFRNDPMAGIAGQYPNTYSGEPWNIRWPQQRILNSTRSWKFFRRPLANLLLIKFYRRALDNGYRTGESVFGGAYFISQLCLEKLMAEHLLPAGSFRALNLGEDHLFSLLAKAIGFGLESLSNNGGPMACEWKGLPASPKELLLKRKKIIHSVTSWNGMDEWMIREYFREKRNAGNGTSTI